MSYRCNRCDFRSDDDEAIRQHAWVDPRHPRCIICTRSLPLEAKQTCPGCVTSLRVDLADLEHAYVMLPDVVKVSGYSGQMGGDALVMLAPGATESAEQQWHPDRYVYLNSRGQPVGAELMRDPVPTHAMLQTWEDDWRETFGQPVAVVTTVSTAIAYLTRMLDRAAQEHPAFDDWAADVRTYLRRLQWVSGDLDDPKRGNVDCLDCGGRITADYQPPAVPAPVRVGNAAHAYRQAVAQRELERAAVKRRNEAALRDDPDAELEPVPAPLTTPELRLVVTGAVVGRHSEGLRHHHEHGETLRPLWRCSRCKREYDDESYRLAQRAALEGVDGYVTVRIAHEQTGASERRIRYWIDNQKARSTRDEHGRQLVMLGDCRALVAAKHQRVRLANDTDGIYCA